MPNNKCARVGKMINETTREAIKAKVLTQCIENPLSHSACNQMPEAGSTLATH